MHERYDFFNYLASIKVYKRTANYASSIERQGEQAENITGNNYQG